MSEKGFRTIIRITQQEADFLSRRYNTSILKHSMPDEADTLLKKIFDDLVTEFGEEK